MTPCCQRSKQIMAKYGKTAKAFLLAVTPAQQSALYSNKDDCYFGDYPTLGELNRTYTPQTAQAWLIPQLTDLSEYCGARDKFTENQLKQCSGIIASDYYYLKVSELMLFFSRFKRCCYGRFYGTVDPLVVTEALKEFCRERNVAYCEREKEAALRQMEESRKNSCTWEEFLKRKGEGMRPSPLSKAEKRITRQ